VGAMLAFVGASFTGANSVLSASNPIQTENQQAGTDAWQIPLDGFSQSDDTNNQIKAYAAAPSVNRGGTLTFHVTVNPVQNYTIDFYRLGYYQGLGGRLMRHVGSRAGVTQAPCPTVDASTGLIACGWTPSYTLSVPTGWTDGIYFAVFSNAQKFQTFVPFVVRNDSRQATLVYQQPVNTYEAYNNYGGKSLYSFNSTNGPAYKVSFDRPYVDDGSGDFFGWEVYLVQWLEQKGYDVTYTTDVDVDANANRLKSFKGVVVGGHSEYWSKGMYDAVQAARDAGVSLAFMGSNDVYWQVRYEPSPAGVAHRVLVAYKTSEPPNAIDPITATQPSLTTTQWRQNPVNRPEQGLLGVQFTSQTGDTWDSTVPYVVTNSSDPLYAGSGLADGSSVPGIVGYEADRQWAEYPRPSSQSATLLSNSPYTSVIGLADHQNASLYKALSGAWVFSAGTEAWPWALSRPGYISPAIQQATVNLLNMMVNNVPVKVTPTPTPTPIASAYRTSVMNANPAAYWRLGETSGITALDQKGAHNGTYANGPTLGAPGALTGDVDKAVTFNGSTQFANVLSDASLNTPTFSVELWAMPTGGDGNYRGAAASRFYPTGWTLYLDGAGFWEFWINSGTGMVSVGGGTAPLNTWQHVVGTYDGTTATLYFNGVAVASGNVTSYQPQTRNPTTIGQGEPGASAFFPGSIDDPALYSRALTAAEVQSHYSLGTTGH